MTMEGLQVGGKSDEYENWLKMLWDQFESGMEESRKGEVENF